MSLIKSSQSLMSDRIVDPNAKYKQLMKNYLDTVPKEISLEHKGFSDYTKEQDVYTALKTTMNIDPTDAAGASQLKNNMITKFNRFLLAYPNLQLNKTFGHVFFTRPDLNLYKSDGGDYPPLLDKVANDPLFYYLNRNEPKILQSLTSRFTTTHGFNPYLSNLAKNFELSDEQIKTEEYGTTFTGFKIKYGRHNIESKTAGSFSIKYRDDKDYGIFKLHKAWVDYISKVYRGQLKASDYNIKNRILDYACSVYFFLCGPDGETILFWSKYTGVFPTVVPSAASSWSYGDLVNMPEYSISYDYSWKDDFNPVHIGEFNVIANNGTQPSYFEYLRTYNPSTLSVGRTFTGAPFIQIIGSDESSDMTFKLRFRPSY